MGKNEENDLTYKEQKGLPAVEHAKKLAKEKAAKDKLKKQNEASGLHGLMDEVPAHIFYFQRSNKILKCIVTQTGVHTVYVGALDTFNKVKHGAILKPLVEKWKKAGKFIEGESNVDAMADKIKASLNGELPANKKMLKGKK